LSASHEQRAGDGRNASWHCERAPFQPRGLTSVEADNHPPIDAPRLQVREDLIDVLEPRLVNVRPHLAFCGELDRFRETCPAFTESL
jgi:hypothetical protein